jgi:hypothetical protein
MDGPRLRSEVQALLDSLKVEYEVLTSEHRNPGMTIVTFWVSKSPMVSISVGWDKEKG